MLLYNIIFIRLCKIQFIVSLPLATSMMKFTALSMGLARTIQQWWELPKIKLTNGKDVGASGYSKLVAVDPGEGKSMITWQEMNKRGKREKLRCRIFVESRPETTCNVDAILSQCSCAFCDDGRRIIAGDV